jgi:hypothetical protein
MRPVPGTVWARCDRCGMDSAEIRPSRQELREGTEPSGWEYLPDGRVLCPLCSETGPEPTAWPAIRVTSVEV